MSRATIEKLAAVGLEVRRLCMGRAEVPVLIVRMQEKRELTYQGEVN
mgnify:FL=1